MKLTEEETVGGGARSKKVIPPPPSLPSPLPRFCEATKPALRRKIAMGVTNEEIVKFWRQKQVELEDHLLSATKAAARIRAQKLTEDDYKHFEESLKEENDSEEDDATIRTSSKKESRVGIKDWWKESKYAYLNHPPIGTQKRQTSSYIPNFFCYRSTPPPNSSFGSCWVVRGGSDD